MLLKYDVEDSWESFGLQGDPTSRHESEQALGFGDGHGSLASYSLWGHKDLDMTVQLNWSDLYMGTAMGNEGLMHIQN